MLSIKLYAEKEDTWFSSLCKDKTGRDLEVGIMATTAIGAQKRVDDSAKDYGIVETGPVAAIAPADNWKIFA